MPAQPILATTLKNLHTPSTPLLLTNIYDAISARAIASLPGTQALATASHAVAAAAGFNDDDMSLETNLAAVRGISKVAKEYGLPLTVDFQDGYGEDLEEGIKELLEFGVVGVNLEDYDKDAKMMISLDVAVERIERVLATAREKGVDDFVVNARTDALLHDGTISEVIERGKAYLGAGATTVFVWGGSVRGGITREEVRQLVDAFDGKLNVSLKVAEGNLTVRELAGMGVARISIGPALQHAATKTFGEVAEGLIASR